SLSLNLDKTRLIEFGRFAAERRAQRGLGKPETFNFPRLYLHLRTQQSWAVPREEDHTARSHAGDAQGDHGGTTTANALPNPRARGLEQAGGQSLLRLPCSANQRRCTEGILLLCGAYLVAHAAAT